MNLRVREPEGGVEKGPMVVWSTLRRAELNVRGGRNFDIQSPSLR
jgi:hypothetical protein